MTQRAAIMVSREVYEKLSAIAAGWGMTVNDYTNQSLQKILFEPATRNAFAFNMWVKLTRDRHNRYRHDASERLRMEQERLR
jgi:hypothetical protein